MRICAQVGAVAALYACGGCSSSRQAQDWVEVGAASDGVKVYVDTRSVAAGDGGVRLRQRFVFPKDHALGKVDQQAFYSCDRKSVTTLESVEFNRAGRVVRADKSAAVPPYTILPGTLPEYIFDLVC